MPKCVFALVVIVACALSHAVVSGQACPASPAALPHPAPQENPLLTPTWRNLSSWATWFVVDTHFSLTATNLKGVVYDSWSKSVLVAADAKLVRRLPDGRQFTRNFTLAGVIASAAITRDSVTIYFATINNGDFFLRSVPNSVEMESGTMSTVFGNGIRGVPQQQRVGTLRSMAFYTNDIILAADSSSNCIVSFNTQSSQLTQFACSCSEVAPEPVDGPLASCEALAPIAISVVVASPTGVIAYFAEATTNVRKITTASVVTVMVDSDSKSLTSLFAHPAYDDTLWVWSGRTVMFRSNATSSVSSFQSMTLLNGNSGDYFCRSRVSHISSATFNFHTGEMYLLDAANQKVWRVDGLLTIPLIPRFASFTDPQRFLSLPTRIRGYLQDSALTHQGVYNAVTGRYFVVDAYTLQSFHSATATTASTLYPGTISSFTTGCTTDTLGTRVFVTSQFQIQAVDVDQPNQVFRVAGTGQSGWTSGPAMTSLMGLPRFLFRVNSGVYFGDTTYNCVRKYDYVAESLADYACKCQISSTTTDGSFAVCEARRPYGIAFMTTFSNRIGYFTEENNFVRKMDSFYRTVTTVGRSSASPSNGVMPHPFFDNVLYTGCYGTCSGGYFSFWNGPHSNRTAVWSWLQPPQVGVMANTRGTQVVNADVNWDTGVFYISDRANGAVIEASSLWGELRWNATRRYNDAFSTFGGWQLRTLTDMWPAPAQQDPLQLVHSDFDGNVYFTAKNGLVYRWTVHAAHSNLTAWSSVVLTGALGIAVEESGNILVGTLGQLFRLDRHTAAPTSVAGSGVAGYVMGAAAAARFGHWSSLYRVGASVFAADSTNNCVMRFAENAVSAYACRCSESGSEDGTFDACTATAIEGLSFMNHSSSAIGYFVHGGGSTRGVVRRMSEFWGAVTTVYIGPTTSRFRGLLVHPFDQHLLFVSDVGLGSKGLLLIRRGANVTHAASGLYERVDGSVSQRSSALGGVSSMSLNELTGEVLVADNLHRAIHSICCLWNSTTTPTVSISHQPTLTKTDGSLSASEHATVSITATDETTQTASTTASFSVDDTSSTTVSFSGSPSRSITPPRTRSGSLTCSLSQSPTRSGRTSSPSAVLSATRTVNVPTSASSTRSATMTTSPTLTEGSDSRSRSAIWSASSTAPVTSTATKMRTSTSSFTFSSATTLSVSQTLKPVHPTLAPSTWAPPLPPGEACAPVPQQQPIVELLLDESLIRRSRVVLNISLSRQLAAEGALGEAPAFAFPFDIPPREWGLGVAVGDGRTAPSDLGFLEMVSAFSSATNASNITGAPRLIYVARDRLTFEVGPLPNYDITALEETLTVHIGASWLPNATHMCGGAEALTRGERRLIEVGRVVVAPEADRLLQDVAVATAVVGQTAVVAGVVGSSAGADMQSLAIMGLMSCTRPAQKAMAGNTRLLSPTQLDSTFEGMLLGNLCLFAGISAIHFLCVYCHQHVLRRPESWSVLRFPSLTLSVLSAWHNGTLYLALRLLLTDTRPSVSRVIGAAGVAYAVIVPIISVFVATKQIHATFNLYGYDQVVERRSRLRTIATVVLPFGRWEPKPMRQSHGILFSSFSKASPLWALFRFVSPSVIALSATATPSDRMGCVAQYACIAAFQAVYTLFLAISRPYRSRTSNVLSVFSSLSVVVISICTTIAIDDPLKADSVTDAAAYANIAQVGFTIARLAFNVFTMICESRINAAVPLIPLFSRGHGGRNADKAASEPLISTRSPNRARALTTSGIDVLPSSDSDGEMMLKPQGTRGVDAGVATLDDVLSSAGDQSEDIDSDDVRDAPIAVPRQRSLSLTSSSSDDDQSSSPAQQRYVAISAAAVINRDELSELLDLDADDDDQGHTRYEHFL